MSVARCIIRFLSRSSEPNLCDAALSAAYSSRAASCRLAGGGSGFPGCARQFRDGYAATTHETTRLHARVYSRVPEPDPEVNPEPSQRVIDIVDAIENLTVKEAVWLCKLQQERFGITDAELGMGPMGYVPAAAPAAAPAAEEAAAEATAPEKTEFDVIIDSYDTPAKIKIIKEVRSVLPELGLKQAKELVRRSGHT
jgi:ribosomal protein L7/L12